MHSSCTLDGYECTACGTFRTQGTRLAYRTTDLPSVAKSQLRMCTCSVYINILMRVYPFRLQKIAA